jgi:predicted Zn-dependent protease
MGRFKNILRATGTVVLLVIGAILVAWPVQRVAGERAGGERNDVGPDAAVAAELVNRAEVSARFVLRWHARQPEKDVLAEYESLDRVAVKDPYVRAGFASVSVEYNNRASASEALTKLARDYPNSVSVQYALARLHLGLRDEAVGVAHLEQALKIDPFHAPSLLAMAQHLIAISKVDKAAEYASRVLAVETPGSPLAAQALGLLEKTLRRGGIATSSTSQIE